MTSMSADLVKRMAALAHLPISSDRAEFVSRAYTDMLKLLDLLEDAQIGATEPASVFKQQRPA